MLSGTFSLQQRTPFELTWERAYRENSKADERGHRQQQTIKRPHLYMYIFLLLPTHTRTISSHFQFAKFFSHLSFLFFFLFSFFPLLAPSLKLQLIRNKLLCFLAFFLTMAPIIFDRNTWALEFFLLGGIES